MALSEISYPWVRLVTSAVLLVHAARVMASRAAAASGAMEPEAVRRGMNLTFPMALDYRHGNKAATLWPPKCLAANLSIWQAGIGPVRPFASVRLIEMLSAIP